MFVTRSRKRTVDEGGQNTTIGVMNKFKNGRSRRNTKTPPSLNTAFIRYLANSPVVGKSVNPMLLMIPDLEFANRVLKLSLAGPGYRMDFREMLARVDTGPFSDFVGVIGSLIARGIRKRLADPPFKFEVADLRNVG